jgi:hypothetical protein
MQFYNNFIGYELQYHHELFTGSDSEERFSQSLITQPRDWHYRTNPISYIRNSVGHRSKELSNLDLSNYVLFTGCSTTEGTGLELERTYSHVVSSNLNTDYYNLALGGTGTDVVSYNLIQWHNLVKSNPKALVIQWPEPARFSKINTRDGEEYLQTIGPWSIKDNNDIGNCLVYGKSYFTSKKFMLRKLIKSLFTCPIIEIEIEMIYHINSITEELARDNSHPGIKSQLHIANIIEEKIRNAI